MFDTTIIIGLYSWLTVGLCALALGLAGLLRRGKGRAAPGWRLPALLGVVMALAAGGLVLAGQPARAALAPAALAVVGLTFALFRTGLPRSASLFVLEAAARPKVQSLGLFLLGGAVLGWQSYSLTRELEADLAETDQHLTALIGTPALQPSTYSARTDAGGQIPLWQLAPGDEADDALALHYLHNERFEVKLIQTDGPDARYNCHGQVFAGGKAGVRGT